MLPQVKPNTPVGVWANAVNKTIRANTTNDLSALQSVGGTGTVVTPKLISTIHQPNLVPTAHSLTAFYAVGDLVFVRDDMYVQQEYNGVPDPTIYHIPAGVWQCIKMVPTVDFQTEGITPEAELKSYGPQYWRYSFVNYYPVFPMPRDPDKHYWLLISLYPLTMKSCVDGVTHTYYVSATESGSLPPAGSF